ncbi:MAG TPA: DUF3224 domain-containing protein, partial [Devosiaceae bacterium]|nr:DUF3224 domain-containing protein [Devosiaceae bacterium]
EEEAKVPSVRGQFDVKTLPQAPDSDPDFAAVSRLLLDKRFHGALDAVSRGQMLAIGGEGGWGVYVAIEKVEGVLDGRRGSFILYHNGTMTPDRGQQLSVTVAPQSGTGELIGISGRMGIEVVDGKHFYGFDYEL